MGDNKRRMLAGDWYIPDDPDLAADTARRIELCTAYNAAASGASADERTRILRQLLGAVGDRVRIRAPFACDYGYHISVGDRTFVNFGAVFLDAAAIIIGTDVQIGPNVQLLTPVHELDPTRRRAGWEKAIPVTIGDNVWLGAGAIVCPGVSVGDDTVIGAGSVVTRDVPPGVLAVGNPARIVRRL